MIIFHTLPYSMVCYDHTQASWLMRKIPRTQKLLYPWLCFLRMKEYRSKQQREKIHGVKSRRNQKQASSCPVPMESYTDVLNSPSSTVWQSVWGIANLGSPHKPWYPEFLLGIHHTGSQCLHGWLSYSYSSSFTFCPPYPDVLSKNRHLP